MTRARKPKGDALQRKLVALGKLGRTKAGRQIITECREGILSCLCDAVGKP